MEKNNDVSRKDFLRTAGSTALFAALGISFVGCDVTGTPDDDTITDPPNGSGSGITVSGNVTTIDLTKSDTSVLAGQGGWLLIGQSQLLAVNVDGDTIRAFTSVCTHAGCATSWAFSNNLFTCNCHGSQFNTSGGVVRGPASADLQEFSVERSGNIVTITK